MDKTEEDRVLDALLKQLNAEGVKCTLKETGGRSWLVMSYKNKGAELYADDARQRFIVDPARDMELLGEKAFEHFSQATTFIRQWLDLPP